MADWAVVGSADGDDGEVRGTRVNGVYVVLAKAEGEWFALDDWCSHEECPLSDGWVEGEKIVCHCHGSEFDVRTGQALSGPATEPVKTYPARVVDEKIEVQVEESRRPA
jgi:3-phenylpropionate/trans-cinnamate dioxygenase ferredoxin subunit